MGLGRKAIVAGLLFVSFYGGYKLHSYSLSRRPYKVEVIEGKYYLKNNRTNERRIINPDNTTGTLQEQVEALLLRGQEDPSKLEESLFFVGKKYRLPLP